MKCIKERCDYYEEDDFKGSCFRCQLEGTLRKKSGQCECCIDDFIDESRSRIEDLKTVRNKIFSVQ